MNNGYDTDSNFYAGFFAIDEQYDLPKKYPDEYASILTRVEKFLVHPHAWARQSATKIIKAALERVDYGSFFGSLQFFNLCFRKFE